MGEADLLHSSPGILQMQYVRPKTRSCFAKNDDCSKDQPSDLGLRLISFEFIYFILPEIHHVFALLQKMDRGDLPFFFFFEIYLDKCAILVIVYVFAIRIHVKNVLGVHCTECPS